jgi:hypothetical protein
MRSRLAGIFLFGAVLTWAAGACNTAGVSYVYMAIDSGGAQHRQGFFTDSTAIYCIAKFSSARQDATLDFVFRQTGVFPWCAALANPTKADETPVDLYNIFALGEQTPGVGTETVVAEELLPNGTPLNIPCNGYIAPNLPSGNICGASGGGGCGSETSPCTGEGISFASEGANSGGPGFTCCATLIVGQSMTVTAPSVIPYPAGVYTCTVSLDGNVAGETTFTIDYPGFPFSSCPAASIPDKTGKSVPCFCPSPPPVNGIPCYNWVPEGAVCPSNTPTINCTCNSCGVWECPG